MAWEDEQDNLTMETRLFLASPEVVFQELKKLSARTKSDWWSGRNDRLEPILVERNDPLVHPGSGLDARPRAARSRRDQGICELRNRCGFAAHGSDKPRPAMESVQALLAAEAADTIVGFLHRVHRQDRVPPPSPQTPYDENPSFNDSVDEAHGAIRIFDIEFRPSEVLFQLEPESYRIYLAEFDEGTDGAAADGGVKSEAAP